MLFETGNPQSRVEFAQSMPYRSNGIDFVLICGEKKD